MRRDVLELDAARVPPPLPTALSLMEIEAIRLVLSGASVIDWARMAFLAHADVDRFLRLHLVDYGDPNDRERVRYVFNEAVSYLEENLQLRFPAEVRNPADVRDVFLYASQTGAFRRRQILSCVVLKLMHVIHHMEAADLKFKLPISEERLFDLAEARVLREARAMRESGLPIVSFYGSRKTRSSIVTKLLAKKENIAATIFDKLRFRIVVERKEHLIPTLAYMTAHMFPFNFVIPGQSHNNLLDPEQLWAWLEKDAEPQAMRSERILEPKNEFSGASYRMINFIVDYPVRVPEVLTTGFPFELGRVVYLMVEFQLLDEETARTNEEGENSHRLYKERQQKVVERRLKRGGARRKAPPKG